jgi:hypothetical protein
MNIHWRHFSVPLVQLLLCCVATSRADVPSFITLDQRLPNPDRPYDMISDTVFFFGGANELGLYDLQFQPTNPSQLDVPAVNRDGNWEFESVFDIAYKAQISFGLGPVHGVNGIGTAHMRGVSPAGAEPREFDTDLLALNLVGLSSDSAFMFRESPTLRSHGLTIVEDTCPECARPVVINRVSSFFDVFAEASADGGKTWAPGDKSFQIVQQTESVVLGDYNESGTVDAADYVVWRDKLGPGGLPNEGGISPGVVDDADYNYWRSRFGARAGFQPTLASSIPEPATSLLLMAVAVTALLSRRPPTARAPEY